MKQMLVGLNREVPEEPGMIIPDYSFWFHPPVSRSHSAHIALYTIEAKLLSLSVVGPCELSAAADDMRHGLCMLVAQRASGVLHSVVDLVCHCPGVEGLLLSCHDQSLDVHSDVAFIEPLICSG